MYLIANFKENLNSDQLNEYFDCFTSKISSLNVNTNLKIIFCPSYPFLELVKSKIESFPNFYIGAQTVSEYEIGSYTGEVSASQISDFCSYCIVGHSERRKNKGETNAQVNNKINFLLKSNIKPIVCVSTKDEFDSIENKKNVLIAYEPVENIGGTAAASNDSIRQFYNTLKTDNGLIYGGSVNYGNVEKITELDFIEGFLIGSASLKCEDFFKLLEILYK
ncbi:hypothetical protein COV24_04020 [candidate division WWE3 bacterium CG10_big_fil_rev_8_21_14_0_10_32_10]|uniref:Triosephosphate isomerase n=1 Tax=candidate division WWE3 bacterium CG10_big_fil_rev_8_21_14_0_10_32_10 TaxID=1975090 RepID=A0A2H0R9J8_UNCKA|nr:MAG: hypothetical protein COV24_04020 [candidate division WWE3 bacterium CG10_big_fil_rev_8_21_14_0_10_32_10]